MLNKQKVKKINTAIIIMLTTCSVYSTEYHVSTTGLNENAGSKSKPFKTISAAATVAQPGDVITVHEGSYRERVNPPRGGTSDDKRITYQAAPGEKVVIKGSEIIKGWEKVKNDTWKVIVPNTSFGDFNPYTDRIHGEWYKKPKDGYDRHTGAVYLNEQWLTEAKELDLVLQPSGDEQLWFAEVDNEKTTLWAQFKGVDPNKEVVEINVRQSIFYPDQPGRNYITVRGFVMRQAATPWSGAMSEQIGLIGTHWSRGWIIENNVISHSMNTGITLGRYDLSNFGIAMPAVSAPGFVKSCELALEHGWSKEKIGSHIVRNNHISYCEKNGIHGSLGGIFSTIENNVIHDIALHGWISGPDVAGLKLLASNDVIIRNNHIYRCGGHGGIWLDWMAQGTRVTGNLFHDNNKDLFVEVNHGPFLIDNNIFLSKFAILESSEGGAYVHNLICGEIKLRSETRFTPYFRPHSIKDMKLANFTHGDERYFNNLLVGASGLPDYGKAENITLEGNVHLKGLGIQVEQQEDGVWIRLPQDSAWAAQKRSIVTTELLGKAAIPNAPFVNRDGAPYRLDADYFGKKRNANPMPGPVLLDAGAQLITKPPKIADRVLGGKTAQYLGKAIKGTEEDQLYQSCRYDVQGYELSVPNGTYKVTLKFCEPYFAAKGKRVCDVKLQGKTVLENFDIFAEVGQFAACDKTFDTKVTAGVLKVDIINRVSMACISGIEVKGNGFVKRINCGGKKWQDYAADPVDSASFAGGVRIKVWPKE